MQLIAETLSEGQLLGKSYWVTEVTAGHDGLIFKGFLTKYNTKSTKFISSLPAV